MSPEDEIMAEIDASQGPELSSRAKEYLSVLNPQQYEAAVHEGSPLLILAGAGSGKTRVITTKIAYLIAERNVNPYSILAVTFTKKAAKEMLERAVALEERAQGAQIRTFHSFGAWFLRLYAEEAGVDPNFTVYDDDDMVTLVSKANSSLTRQQASHFAHIISLCKDYCIFPEDALKIKEIEPDPDFPRIYANYNRRLRETGNVDFGDLILLPVQVLEKNEYVRDRIHGRFSVIMVDEYQDSNVAQFRLLRALTGKDTYVCVVGDDDQSIYKFRGAEIQNILQFKNHFPGTQIIRLESNYRSKSQILSVADDVVKNNSGRLGKNLTAERGDGKTPVLAFLPNQDEEAHFCADLIAQTHKNGVPYCDWAVLYRTNAQSMGFEAEFLRRKIPYTVVGSLKFYEREEIKDLLAYLALLANPKDELAFRRIVNKPARGIGAMTQDKLVDYYRTNTALFSGEQNPSVQAAETDRVESGDVKNYLDSCRILLPSLSKKAREGLSAFVDFMESFEKKLGEDTSGDDKAPASAEDTAGAGKAPAAEKLSVLVDLIIEKSGLKEYHASQDEIGGTQRVLNLQELSNSAVLYECSRKGLLEFLDHIELDRTIENPEVEEDKDQVTLITLHNTKGLEFNRVIITGMELGVFPRQDKYGEDLEEERRLCYVGVTRAKDELYLTSCAVRRMYGRIEYMAPSPFLSEINPDRLKILGHLPFGFKKSSGAKAYASHSGDYGSFGLSHPDVESDPIKKKYCRGTKIFHDDYGYGVITSGVTTDDGEYSITVQFENGGIKKFLPKYQEKSLLIVKD